MPLSLVNVLRAAEAGAAKAPTVPAASARATGTASRRVRRESEVMSGTLGADSPLGNLV